jgi:hypothetical protein
VIHSLWGVWCSVECGVQGSGGRGQGAGAIGCEGLGLGLKVSVGRSRRRIKGSRVQGSGFPLRGLRNN